MIPENLEIGLLEQKIRYGNIENLSIEILNQKTKTEPPHKAQTTQLDINQL